MTWWTCVTVDKYTMNIILGDKFWFNYCLYSFLISDEGTEGAGGSVRRSDAADHFGTRKTWETSEKRAYTGLYISERSLSKRYTTLMFQYASLSSSLQQQFTCDAFSMHAKLTRLGLMFCCYIYIILSFVFIMILWLLLFVVFGGEVAKRIWSGGKRPWIDLATPTHFQQKRLSDCNFFVHIEYNPKEQS